MIGLGKIAQDQHLPVVAKTPDPGLAAVVSSRVDGALLGLVSACVMLARRRDTEAFP